MDVISKRGRTYWFLMPLLVLLVVAAVVDLRDGALFTSKKRIKSQVSQSHEWLDTAAKIRWALKNAEEIRVYDNYSDQRPFAILSERSHPEMFRLLKEKTSVQSHRDNLKLDALGRSVILVSGTGYEVGYDPYMGIITGTTKEFTTKEFGTVPPEVRGWLQKLIAANQKRNPKRR